MPVIPPKCKFCDHLHWERICPNIGRAKITVMPAEPRTPARAALPPPAKKKKKKAKA